MSSSIETADKPLEERFYNMRVDTNGAVASVWFDVDFLEDGKVTNCGSERLAGGARGKWLEDQFDAVFDGRLRR